jgi:aryl-alcohol dehydrogenase-like predicted oxidoreductase
MSIILGSAQFGLDYGISNTNGVVAEDKIKEILDFALQNGINEIDSAINYGSSHAALGKIKNDLEVSSKLPALDLSAKKIKKQIRDLFNISLQQLNKASLKTLYLHSPQQLLEPGGDAIYKNLLQLKSDGCIKSIGISVYEPIELRIILQNFDIDVVQIPFNLIDQRFDEDNFLSRLKKKNIEINCRSIFLQGLLLMSLSKLPKQFLPWENLFLDWSKWLKMNNIHPVHACIAYILCNHEIDNIVIGVESVDQLAQIISFYERDDHASILFPNIKSESQGLVNPSYWDAS